MSIIKHPSGWSLFLFASFLLLSGCFANFDKGIPTDETGGLEDETDLEEDPARKPLRVKDTVFDLCQNLPGCTCDGKHERANCGCIIGDQGKLRKINFENVRVPKTITTLNVVDCPFVDFTQTKFAELPMKSFNFLRIGHLQIASGSLRKVDRLSLQQVNKLVCNNDAFTQLEADTVTFVNVTFPVGIEIVPISIISELKIVRCNLTDVTIIVDRLPTDRSVSINHNYLDRLSLKINAATFSMDGNHFAALSSTSGLMDIAYSDMLNLTNNQFSTKNVLSFMPDVMSSNASLIFKAPTFSAESMRWLEHFKFEYEDTTVKSLTNSGGKGVPTTCEEQILTDSTNNRILTCPNVKILGDFLNSKGKSEPRSEHQPEKQKQIQTNHDVASDSAQVLHYYPALILVITAGVMMMICNSKV
ncbi:uncharacterized protein LOC130694920 [Daphnia carinata]|uniref:uncharacterized protein LOC130694920 n=1 Tax=Daphnia carinata TaxID=120202 RepID=UPI00257DCD66|nr:uncharacterized protein LOC130694920 [Daphnia carinata]